MTPREVEAMSPDEYRAFVRYQNREIREAKKAAAKRNRR